MISIDCPPPASSWARWISELSVASGRRVAGSKPPMTTREILFVTFPETDAKNEATISGLASGYNYRGSQKYRPASQRAGSSTRLRQIGFLMVGMRSIYPSFVAGGDRGPEILDHPCKQQPWAMTLFPDEEVIRGLYPLVSCRSP